MMNAIRRCISKTERFKKSQDGATAIEFAMLAAPFLYLLLMIFELSILLLTEYLIEQGTSEAAREIRTGQAKTNGATEASFRGKICGKLEKLLKCQQRMHIDVRTWPSFNAIAQPPSTEQNSDGDTVLSEEITKKKKFSTGGGQTVQTVKVYYTYPLFLSATISMGGKYIGLANLANNERLLTAGAVFRNEPF